MLDQGMKGDPHWHANIGLVPSLILEVEEGLLTPDQVGQQDNDGVECEFVMLIEILQSRLFHSFGPRLVFILLSIVLELLSKLLNHCAHTRKGKDARVWGKREKQEDLWRGYGVAMEASQRLCRSRLVEC